MNWQPMVRRVAFGLLIPFVGVLLAVALLLGRLAQGPLDVTGLSHRWGGALTHIGGGTLQWERMTLAWQPQKGGHSSKLLLQLDNIRFIAPSAPIQHIEHVGFTFKLASLLRGTVRARSLEVQGVNVTLIKTLQGRVQVAGMGRNARTHHRFGGDESFASLVPYHMDVRDLHLTMLDEAQPDASLVMSMPEMQADYEPQSGWRGQFAFSLQGPGLVDGTERGTVQIKGDIAPEGSGKSHWHFTLSPMRLPALAPWIPVANEQKKGLLVANLPLAFQLEGQFQQRGVLGAFETLSGTVDAGAGEVIRPGKMPFRVSSARSHFTFGPAHADKSEPWALALHTDLTALDSHEIPVPFVIDAHGEMDHLQHAHNVSLTVDGKVAAFDFATLASVWPEGAARGARRWMTTNMTAGRGDHLRLILYFSSTTGLAGLDVHALDGDLIGHGLNVTWLDNMPQVTGEYAHAHFIGPETFQIDLQHGHIADGKGGMVLLPSGRIILSDLLHHEQMGEFSLGMEGKLPPFLYILSAPRLNLLARHPVDPATTQGEMKGTFTIKLPLKKHLSMKELQFGAAFDIRDIGIAMPGIDHVQQGWGRLSINETSLTIKGGAVFRGLTVAGSVFDSFQSNVAGRLLLKADLTAPLGVAEFRTLGVPASIAQPSVLKGKAQSHVVYEQYGLGNKHKRTTAHLQLDLTPLAVTASFWQKPAGADAGLTGTILWENGQLIGLDDVQVHGPQIALKAEGRVRQGQVGGVHLTHFQLGRTEGNAVLDWPLKGDLTARYQANIQAELLDLTPWWGKKKGQPVAKPPAGAGKSPSKSRTSFLPAGTWKVSLEANKVLYGKEKTASHVIVRAQWTAYHVTELALHVRQPNPLAFDLTPIPGQEGAYDVKFTVADFGAWLASLGIYQQFTGGAVDLEGRCQPVASGGSVTEAERTMGVGLGLPPFTGRLKIDNLALEHPPTPLVVATLAAPLHWGQISRDRFEDVQIRAAFHVAGNRLDVEDGRASNAIFGGTIKGQVDLGQEMLHMQGTLSPFFGVNQAAGSVFGAKKGSGAMAVTYKLEGSFAKPALHVNYLSAFVPAILRRLFE
ncbi:AsmA-like C-terminal region-containing protein [Bombella pollinis]|uniref:AsmA-like C-terminal region-containing protein n=1 Tax=Bombella pollinis TaxID=2967337 RepID=A0ABT3WRV6_9PROT|nr:AsmA-like C-terminal region-containing protein [Bombella pollinis]MCX5619571.1 AsmA-like C-terminal region-containing protein [Bombella pollinis]